MIHVFTGDRLTDFHRVGDDQGLPNPGPKINVNRSDAWSHVVLPDNRVVALLASDTGIYGFALDSTSHIKPYFHYTLANSTFTQFSRLTPIVVGNRAFLALTGGIPAISGNNNDNVYDLGTIPEVPAWETTTTHEDKVKQCLGNLETLLAEKMEVLSRVRENLKSCIPVDGSRGLTYTNLRINGNLNIGDAKIREISALPGEEFMRSENKLRSTVSKLKKMVGSMEESVNNLVLMQKKKSDDAQKIISFKTLTMVANQNTTVLGKNIGELIENGVTSSNEQVISGNWRVTNCQINGLQTSKINNVPTEDIVVANEPTEFKGKMTFANNVHFNDTVTLKENCTLNKMSVRNICNRNERTSFQSLTIGVLQAGRITAKGRVNGVENIADHLRTFLNKDDPQQFSTSPITLNKVTVEKGNIKVRTINGIDAQELNKIAQVENGVLKINGDVHISGKLQAKNTTVRGERKMNATEDVTVFNGDVIVKNLFSAKVVNTDTINGILCSKIVDTSQNNITFKTMPVFRNLNIDQLVMPPKKTIDSLDLSSDLTLSPTSMESLVITEDTTVQNLEVKNVLGIKRYNGNDFDEQLKACARFDVQNLNFHEIKAEKVVFKTSVEVDKFNNVSLENYVKLHSDQVQFIQRPMVFSHATFLSLDPQGQFHSGEECNVLNALSDAVLVSPDIPNIDVNGTKTIRMLQTNDADFETLNNYDARKLFGSDKEYDYRSPIRFSDELVLRGDAWIFENFTAESYNDVKIKEAFENAVYVTPSTDGKPLEFCGNVTFGELNANAVNVDWIDGHINVAKTLQNGIECDTDRNSVQHIEAQHATVKGWLTCENLNNVSLTHFMKYELVSRNRPMEISGKVRFKELSVNQFVGPIDNVDVGQKLSNALTTHSSQTCTCQLSAQGNVSIKHLIVNDSLAEVPISDLMYTDDSLQLTEGTTAVFKQGLTIDRSFFTDNAEFRGNTKSCSPVKVYKSLKSYTSMTSPEEVRQIRSADNMRVTGNCQVDMLNGFSANELPHGLVRKDISSPQYVSSVHFHKGFHAENLNVTTVGDVQDVPSLLDQLWDPEDEMKPLRNLQIEGKCSIKKLIAKLSNNVTINGRNLSAEAANLVSPTEREVLIHQPSTFKNLTCKQAEISGSLNNISSLDDIIRKNDSRVISEPLTFAKGLTVKNLEATMLNNWPFKQKLENLLTSDKVQKIPELRTRENVKIGTLCVNKGINNLKPKEIVTTSETQNGEMPGNVKVQGTVHVYGNCEVKRINDQDGDTFLSDYVTVDREMTFDNVEFTEKFELGKDAEIHVADIIDDYDETPVEHLVQYEKRLAGNGNIPQTQARDALKALENELERKRTEMAEKKGCGMMSKFEMRDMYRYQGGVRMLLLKRPSGLSPQILMHKDTSAGFCTSRETVHLSVEPQNHKLLFVAEYQGTTYAHHPQSGNVYGIKVSTNVFADMRENFVQRCFGPETHRFTTVKSFPVADVKFAEDQVIRSPKNESNDQPSTSLAVSSTGSQSPEGLSRRKRTLTDLKLDLNLSVGDVSFVEWNNRIFVIIGYKYDHVKDTTRSQLDVLEYDNANNYFVRKSDIFIETNGVESIATLSTPEYFYCAVCNNYDSVNKTGVLKSAIYRMGVKDEKFELMVEVETYFCSNVIAFMLQRPVIIFAQHHANTKEGNPFSKNPLVYQLAHPEDITDPSMPFVVSKLKHSVAVNNMAFVKFKGQSYVIAVSSVQKKCVIYLDKGPEQFVKWQTLAVPEATSVIAFPDKTGVTLFLTTRTALISYRSFIL
ncbi:unnamed protein product [Notodromas monacha]|uniref:Uncharacterized protein n=1 Tax=Notodromas monacha TaxID=399045 RepID=A0A7R9BJG1_9CRUS|nr:unnamed protein product [Notodromas monacha]CAG0915089.1 unnamed protein product [Notodromas monacha]